MLSRGRPPKPAWPTRFGRRASALAINTVRPLQRFIDRSFLLAVVIVCILAVAGNYQVSISLFGGFRFEPAQQVEPTNRTSVSTGGTEAKISGAARSSDQTHGELTPLSVAIPAREQPS